MLRRPSREANFPFAGAFLTGILHHQEPYPMASQHNGWWANEDLTKQVQSPLTLYGRSHSKRFEMPLQLPAAASNTATPFGVLIGLIDA